MSVAQRILRPGVTGGTWSRVSAAYARWPLFGHVLQALLVLAIWLLAIAIGLRLNWYPSYVGNYVVLGVVTSLAVAFCRVAPLPALIVVGLANTWPQWDVPELRVIPIVIAVYFATSSGLRPRVAAPVTGVLILLTLVPFSQLGGGYATPASALETFAFDLQYFDPSTRILAALVVIGALLLGNAVRTQRRNVETLRERNTELERLRESDIARIAAEERTALARDIHDVVAHHVSAMVIRAQAADRVADTQPAELRETVRWIAGNGQDALTAMRQVVRVLRADSDAPAPLAPVDFAAALDAIITRVRDTGFTVNETIDADLAPTTMQQAAIVRIVQEALTNVMLHSDATSVGISLRSRKRSIELRIDDEGSEAPMSAVSAGGGGSGIRGMRERAEAAGGSLVAGRLNGRGWTVLVLFPETPRGVIA